MSAGMACAGWWQPDIVPAELRCEYLENPLGIDVLTPRLSWTLEVRGQKQTAYQVLVASSEKLLKEGKADLWDSGKVESEKSVHVEYKGKPLASRMQCFWRVRVWTFKAEDGNKKDKVECSGWSKPALWSMGLLKPDDWHAKWIGHPNNLGYQNSLPARYVRKEISLSNQVQRATAYVCGLGFFELSVNGTKIGDHVMDPVLTSYDKRCCYVTFDVTSALKEGSNAIGVVLGNGRFHAPRRHASRFFGNPMLLLQLEVTYTDGTTVRFVSDDSWKVTDQGPIRANNEYDGEDYDARMEMPGWDKPGYDANKWLQAAVVKAPGGVMQAQMMEPMRITEKIKPVSVKPSPKAGNWMVDFGQSFYGTVHLRVQGKTGDRVSLKGAYGLQSDGSLRSQDNRGAKGTDVYTLKGGGKEEWHPIFCGRGFRHVEVSGFPGTPTPENFEGLVIHTDVARVGDFECSNPLINRIHQNMNWGFRAYLRSVPLDPDRDERQGWNGDPAKDSESEAWNLNVAAFYSKWIDDHRYDQKPNGQLPFVTPAFWPWYDADVLWPSTMMLIPEVLYNYYGERSLIERNYAVMKSFVDYGHSLKTPNGFIKHATFCDWCDVSCIGPAGKRLDRYGRPIRWETGATDGGLLSTAYQYKNEKLLTQFARLLARTEDVARYEAQAAKTFEAFNKEYLDPATGVYFGGTQCAQVVPLAFGMVPEASRSRVIAALIDDIMVKRQGHLSVGLIGMQWLMQTLTDIGRADVAYVLVTQTTKPSWGYMIEKGSTTIWERWDTDTGDASMNSEALLILAGNLDAWFYQTLAGINADPAQPGFKHVIIRPQPVGDLTWVKAHHDSPYGRIASSWKREAGNLKLDVTIPANTTATVYVPAKDETGVTESGKPASKADGVKFLRLENGAAVYEVGSGNYKFQTTFK
jgi:alpha-L-rhamnosidase